MNVNKININQSEQTYDIVSDAYDITYEGSNVGEKLTELVTKTQAISIPTTNDFIIDKTKITKSNG